MEQVTKEKVWRFVNKCVSDVEDNILVEQSPSLYLNGEFINTFKCLPGNTGELALGYLLTSGYIMQKAEIKQVTLSQDGDRVDIAAEVPLARLEAAKSLKNRLSGFNGVEMYRKFEKETDSKRDINLTCKAEAQNLVDIFNLFKKNSELYKTVGGIHSAAVSFNGGMDYFVEDIGRHNAVDRVVARAFMDGRELSECKLFTTGRLHLDMVVKAVQMRVPIFVSRSAPTQAAMDLAESYHLTLCGRVRSDKMTVYVEPWRIKEYGSN